MQNGGGGGEGGSSSSTGEGEEEKTQQTWVHEIFQGTLTNETRCLNCEAVSTLKNSLGFHCVALASPGTASADSSKTLLEILCLPSPGEQ